MDLENQPLPLAEWFGPALATWGFTVACLMVGAIVVAFLFGMVLVGPLKAGDRIFKVVVGGMRDVFSTSPRRVLALARLSWQESLRRGVLWGFLIFLIGALFAGWFIDTGSNDPATLYLSFMLSATMYLVLLLGVYISAFSLPNDILKRTIYTIVTKPVRPTEIVLGRMLGFAAVGSALLGTMGLATYVVVTRGLDHSHEITSRELARLDDEQTAGQAMTTAARDGHRHRLARGEKGGVILISNRGHDHQVTVVESAGSRRYVVGPPRGQLMARVPIYGKLSFRDRSGEDKPIGINVGYEWTYRSYIEGATRAAAVWRFSDLRSENFGDVLRLQMTIRVFRTHKGKIDEGVTARLVLRNPRTKRESRPINFIPSEFSTYERRIPRALRDSKGDHIDLFEDLVSDGGLEVELRCLEPAQFFGMAQPDMYLLARELPFSTNLLKGMLGIWMQMVLVVAFGVMWSTFLNGAVAMMATKATLVGGLFVSFMQQLASGSVLGGGPFEATWRIVNQYNLMGELDKGLGTKALVLADKINQVPLFVISHILPNFRELSVNHYVSSGFDIPWADVVARNLIITAGFLIPVMGAAFLCFKVREVAK